MEKEIVTKRKYFDFNWNDISIRDIKKDLIEMKKLGITHVTIESNGTIDYGCYEERLETDKEFEDRKQWLADRARRIKENELAELKRLKEKYENDR